MSYRDIRNFVEMTRALGFPILISMESFRTPNFPLVAELLVWLVKRFDPDTNIHLQIDTEDDRVQLIRNVAQFMAVKANIMLNTKRLYQSDGYAVKELLKIISLLYNALNTNISEETDESNCKDTFDLSDFDISDKVGDLKLCRHLASEITTSGATLYDLLGKEVDLRAHRQKSISRQFEVNEVENGLKKAVDMIKDDIEETNRLINNVSTTEASLDAKIERRKIEIDRYEKRLQTLKKVRPAFLDEFTSLEKELEDLFQQYSIKLRCLNHLEKLFTESERAQIEKQIVSSPRIEMIPFENNGANHDFLLDDNMDEFMEIDRNERPKAGTEGRGKVKSGGENNMLAGSASSLDLSTDTESDELFLDKNEVELINSDDETLAFEMSAQDRSKSRKRMMSSKPPVQTNSDDDF